MIPDTNTTIISDVAENTSLTAEKVVIIIPTHNEAAGIQTTIEQVFAAVDLIANYTIHVLIFDSASTDNTQEIVKTLQKKHAKLHLRTEPVKSGLGSAYLQAMNYALTDLKANIVFEFDADLSHQPQYIHPMLQQLQTCDCVLGSRYVAMGSIPKNWAFHRKLFSVLGNYIARTFLTPKYKDFTSGFRATRAEHLSRALPTQFLTNHYAYKLELLWTLHKNKARIREYPIEFIDREQGNSKLPKNSIFDSLRVVFTLRYYELKRYLKMCLVGSLGVMVQFSIYNLLRDHTHLSPFTASQIAVFAAVINNFILNNKITFNMKGKTQSPLKLQRFILFVLYSVSIIYLQSYWLRLGIFCFGDGPLQENLIMGVGLGLISLLNYFTYSRHIWAERFIPHN